VIRAGVRRAFRLALRRRDRWEREVEEEIKLHLALRAEQLVAQGFSPDAASAEAIRRFGPLDDARARLIDSAGHREEQMQRTEFLSDLRQDLAFALHTMRRQRGWTAITILTFALGIGATTAVFSVVSSLLLHPLPYPHADRIVYVEQEPSEGNNTGIQVTITPSASVVRAWQAGARSFDALEGMRISPRSLRPRGGGEPESIVSAEIFPTFMTFAGERPLLGRTFTASDIERGERTVLLGESFWRTRFGADSAVLGRAITLSDTTYQVIGVMRASLRIPGFSTGPTDVWLPLDVRDDKLGISLIGRLRPGATPAAAMRELDSLFARSAGFTDRKIPFRARITTPARRLEFYDSLVMLTVAVALVLLVACANVAHLLIARSATRHREMAIRAALGAGRTRLLRQLLTESLMLAAVGTLIGVTMGWAGMRGLVALRPASLDALDAARLDSTTLAIAVAVAALSGIAFGIVGLLQSARGTTHDSLKSGAPTTSQSRSTHRARAVLVVSEMALSATLLVGATMLVRSVINLQRSDLGFEPKGLYYLPLSISRDRFPTAAARAGFAAEYMARLRALPAVRAAAMARVEPGARSFSVGRLEVQGETPPPSSSSSFIDVNQVEAGYFGTMRMAIREGATFSDTSAGGGQVIVNARFARAHWGNRSALGRRIRVTQQGNEPWLTIVGVVSDASTNGPGAESSAPILYTPLDDSARPKVLIRADGDIGALAAALAPLTSLGLERTPRIESVERRIARALAAPRFVTVLLTVFTVLALLLAGIGLYGVMAHSVTQQTREIGIRVALGASGAQIARRVVGRGVALAAAGAALGVFGASVGTKLIEGELYGVTRSDLVSFVAAGVVLLGAALAACVVPARRALAVDPATAIRAD
jgi:putative ABC transport system permease protein